MSAVGDGMVTTENEELITCSNNAPCMLIGRYNDQYRLSVDHPDLVIIPSWRPVADSMMLTYCLTPQPPQPFSGGRHFFESASNLYYAGKPEFHAIQVGWKGKLSPPRAYRLG
jgi:hypothetical protein